MKEETITVEERKQYINTVRESAEKLERLINELFELSKLVYRKNKSPPLNYFLCNNNNNFNTNEKISQ